ncbi:unnamed protein product [Arctia plantaginis]|uniref:Uncharacterized protein n=1 Tax=Arctia plantaginis TaxID=874455 RepID=A0A8S1A5X4_ARCPL|nr:unnamed protein product [Arctia plantaginis]CAB3240575.1 unnamed protein product [Arctia plantaginis]
MTWIVRGGQQLELEECGRAGAGRAAARGASVGVRVPRLDVAAALRAAAVELMSGGYYAGTAATLPTCRELAGRRRHRAAPPPQHHRL